MVKNLILKGNRTYYTIKYLSGNDLVTRAEHELSDVHSYEPVHHNSQKAQPPQVNATTDPSPNPDEIPTTSSPPLPVADNHPIPWLSDNCKVTAYFPHTMKSPKQGFIIKSDNELTFFTGRSTRTMKPYPIPNLHMNLHIYVADNKIVPGWINTKHMKHLQEINDMQDYTIRRMTLLNTMNITALSSSRIKQILATSIPQEYINNKRAHVQASSLDSTVPSPSLRHHSKSSQNDKLIWDRAYLHEYLGLSEDTQTWEYITEKEYQVLRPLIGNALPSMAVSTIKYDEQSNPERAKYRIVVLGNLDPHPWSKTDCFAPIMSHLELRCMIAVAVQLQRSPKTGDFQNAFCQSFLPKQEQHVVRPPPGCSITPSRTYLRLRKTLYGLKRSPRHWYELARKFFTQIGLHTCPNVPCLFTGCIGNNKDIIHVGLYVDDFLYFGSSRAAEIAFETALVKQAIVSFEHNPSHFLGIRITTKHNPDKTFNIHLSQEVIIQNLMEEHNLSPSTNTKSTPYRSGYPVDKVPSNKSLHPAVLDQAQTALRSLVGSFD